MQANAEMAEELNRLDKEIEALLSEQSGAFQEYMKIAQALRRALRQTVQLADQEWIQRITRTTKDLKAAMTAVEINATALEFVGLHAERVGLQHLEVAQDPTTD